MKKVIAVTISIISIPFVSIGVIAQFIKASYKAGGDFYGQFYKYIDKGL